MPENITFDSHFSSHQSKLFPPTFFSSFKRLAGNIAIPLMFKSVVENGTKTIILNFAALI